MGIILGAIRIDKNHYSAKALYDYRLDKSGNESLLRENVYFSGKSTDPKRRKKAAYIAYDENHDCCIVAHARLDYKYELIKHLGYSLIQSESDSKLILLSYIKWGYECLNYLLGDFAFGIYDFKKNILLCARDHFGCVPLLYHSSNQRITFSTHPGNIQKSLSEPVKVSDSWISDCLTLLSPDFSRSPFDEILKLAPAHFFIYENGEISIQRYWNLKVNKAFERHLDFEAIQNFKHKLVNAINTRISESDVVGIELSGGLDSSGIAAIASEVCIKNKNDIIAFSHSLNKDTQVPLFPFKDETKYSAAVCIYARIPKHHLIDGRNSGILEAITNSLETIRYPVSQVYSMLSDQLYIDAHKNDVNILFSGFGGDECVTSSASGYFQELAIKGKWEILKSELKYKHKKWKRQFFTIYLYHLLIRLFPRIYKQYKSKRLKHRKTSIRFDMFGLDKEFEKLHRSKYSFQKQVGFPRDHDVKERQSKRIISNYVTMRLEDSFYMTEKYGISYRYPLLDVKLVEYYFSLSSDLKYRDGIGRYIYRKVLEDFLPDELCWRKEKTGSAIPNIQDRFLKDVEGIEVLINESEEANNYHYVDYHKLRAMVQKVKSRNQNKNTDFAPAILFNHLKILILQKWQREGKIDIGIKC